ncbi:MAG: acyloxyacyl hydrolase [Pseudomonadota bacterium]
MRSCSRWPALLSWTLFLCLAGPAPALADDRAELGVRSLTEYIDSTNLLQHGVFYRWPPKPEKRMRWEIAVGTLRQGGVGRVFVSGGPLWRFSGAQGDKLGRWIIDLGVLPTLLEAGKFGSLDLGGVVQFMSFVSAGTSFGEDDAFRLSLRIQHISNARLNSTNPGADQVGLEFAYRF